MAGSSGFKWTDDTLIRNTKNFDVRLERGIVAVVERTATKVEGTAKRDAPWTDRTGNARNGLTTTTDHDPGKRHVITLFHRVPYGIWLEVRADGKNAVIMPTLTKEGKAMMKLLSRLIERLS